MFFWRWLSNWWQIKQAVLLDNWNILHKIIAFIPHKVLRKESWHLYGYWGLLRPFPRLVSMTSPISCFLNYSYLAQVPYSVLQSSFIFLACTINYIYASARGLPSCTPTHKALSSFLHSHTIPLLWNLSLGSTSSNTSQIFSVHLTLFHPCHFKPLVPACPHILSSVPSNLSIAG